MTILLLYRWLSSSTYGFMPISNIEYLTDDSFGEQLNLDQINELCYEKIVGEAPLQD